MRSIVWTGYGGPNHLAPAELPTPSPAAGEVLVRVRAAGVTAGDGELRRMRLPLGLSGPMRLYVGLFRPRRIRVLGQEFAGVVAAVGEGVTRWAPGDRVFGTTGMGFGAYAEYVIAQESPGDTDGSLAAMPSNLDFARAAVLPTAGMEAQHFLRAAELSPGDEVLVIGAGGSIGSYAVQLARRAGARVIAVDRAEKLELLRELGAHQVVDFAVDETPLERGRYRAIVDVVGRRLSSPFLKALVPGGRYCVANPRLLHIVEGWAARLAGRHLMIQPSDQSAAELADLVALVEDGTLVVPLDRTYELEEAADAHRYLDSGQKKGNIALVVDPEGPEG